MDDAIFMPKMPFVKLYMSVLKIIELHPQMKGLLDEFITLA